MLFEQLVWENQNIQSKISISTKTKAIESKSKNTLYERKLSQNGCLNIISHTLPKVSKKKNKTSTLNIQTESLVFIRPGLNI